MYGWLHQVRQPIAPALEQLNQLATATGGSFFFFSEELQSPDPESYFNRLRNVYEVVYTSDVSQSGDHTIVVEVNYGNQTVKTSEMQFSIDLNLPTAVLVNLPDEIIRTYTDSDNGRVLTPGFITLTAEYLFPDGYDRQLRTTRLYVDGEVVTENTQSPFEFFAWPLESYMFDGEHLLSVEVEDILGFRSISPPVSIQIIVESQYPEWLTSMLKFLTSGGWIPIAITAVGVTIFTGLRIRRRHQELLENRENGFSGEHYIDPLLQQVPGLQIADGERMSGSETIPGDSNGLKEIPPKLVWAAQFPKPFPEDAVQITNEQLIIGKDPQQSDFIIDADSISPQHAVLMRREGGAVSIADMGSKGRNLGKFRSRIQ